METDFEQMRKKILMDYLEKKRKTRNEQGQKAQFELLVQSLQREDDSERPGAIMAELNTLECQQTSLNHSNTFNVCK